jgi:hypothetical protein
MTTYKGLKSESQIIKSNGLVGTESQKDQQLQSTVHFIDDYTMSELRVITI